MDGSLKNCKRAGFGLVEVLASMIIMALMFSAVNLLQKNNYNTALRLQTRNEATQIAQNVLSGLQAVGVNSVRAVSDSVVFGSMYRMNTGEQIRRQYRVTVELEPHAITDVTAHGSFVHIYAKSVSVKVNWLLGNHEAEIQLNSVVQ